MESPQWPWSHQAISQIQSMCGSTFLSPHFTLFRLSLQEGFQCHPHIFFTHTVSRTFTGINSKVGFRGAFEHRRLVQPGPIHVPGIISSRNIRTLLLQCEGTPPCCKITDDSNSFSCGTASALIHERKTPVFSCDVIVSPGFPMWAGLKEHFTENCTFLSVLVIMH